MFTGISLVAICVTALLLIVSIVSSVLFITMKDNKKALHDTASHYGMIGTDRKMF